MASSANWSTETDGKINYTKLYRLLVDGGTQAVRSVFDGIHPPSTLKAVLNANRATLNIEQWEQLYPPSGRDPKSEDFDITLLFVLLRNICGLRAPATGWDALPPVTDDSKGANLARIKYYTKTITAHRPNTEISDTDFEQLWQDISSALVSLGLSQDDIDDLKAAPLGKKDYNQLLDDWYISDRDIKTQLEDVKSDTAKIKSDTADLKSDIADLKSDTAGIKSDTADLKSDTAGIKSDTSDLKSDIADIKSDIQVCMTAPKMDHQLQKLAFSDFRPEINTKCKLFHPNTRQWILDQVKSHVDSDQPDSRIMLITAGPGMGKSTLAAKVCHTYTDQGCLAGCHFFQFSNSTRNNPRLMLQSIAKQMCDTVPGYEKILENKLQRHLGKEISEMNCEELLTILFEEPLCNVEQPKSNLVIVIDALDECSLDPKDELLKALREKLSCFPSWLRFVLTSRLSTNTSELGSTVAVKIEPEDQGNIKDLKVFFTFELKDLYPQCNNDDNADLIENLVEMTKGLFLVAFFIIEHLKREHIASPEKILKLFPNGISSVYENYFPRLKEVLLPHISEGKGFYKMLEAVVATKNPLPKDMFYNILCVKNEREVPRQERKTRKDALNTLHWLFPVEGNHVTTFHKSVIDWLILKEDQEHDFSVRVEDGEEVLASQCNDVVSDIRNGEKDLDEPLSFTDSETYALELLVSLSRRKDPSAIKLAGQYGFFSNAYILTALTFEFGLKKEISDTDRRIPSFIHKMLGNVRRFRISWHWPDCALRRPCTFGSCLTWLLQAAHEEEVSAESLTPKPLEALQKHRLPYYDKDKKSLLPISNELSSFQRCLFKCKDGVVAVFDMRCPNSPRTAVHRFQLDGSLIRKKSFSETSPNINFIVAIEDCGRKIDILHATTLEVVSQYESPHDAVETCHVFGGDQGFFVVIKGRHDNKVYVIEGLTGRVRHTVTVAEGSKVMDVSCQGHIVVSRTWRSDKPEERIRFTNKHGEQVELMNWKSRNEHTYREMFLYRHDRGQEPIPIHPLARRICQCLEYRTNDAVHFSEDGRLLVYEYKGSFFIVHTSDGSLFKRCKGGLSKRIAIVFVSRSYLVILDDDIMCVMNVQTDEIEHRIPLFLPERFGMHQCLLLPEEDGKSFNLIRCYHNPRSHSCEVSRLRFHNLNLQGLQ